MSSILSLAPSSSVPNGPENLPIGPALCHTENSSGRMGLFVDWANCSCQGCDAHRHRTDAAATTEAGLSNVAPTTESTQTTESVMLLPQRSVGGGIGLLSITPEEPVFEWPGPRALGRSSAVSAEPFPVDTEKEALCDSLRGYRATLQMRQDKVYSGPTRSHDEMAAQDAEWDELDRQIHAIEVLLCSLGSFFRSR